MQKFKYVGFLFMLHFLVCCKQYQFKSNLQINEDLDEVRKIAILDFSKQFNTRGKRGTYSVKVDTSRKDIIVVKIGKSCNRLLFNGESQIGKKDNFPSKFLEVNKKIFYWRDNNFPLEKEVVDVLRNYNLVQDNKDGYLFLPDPINVGKLKTSYYFFCRENTLNYKRIKTRKMIDFDEVKLDCML